MDIYKALHEDHLEAKSILKALSETTERAEKTRKEGFQKLKSALTAHARAEEAVFYARMKKNDDLRDDALEGDQEHHLMDILLKEMSSLDVSDEKWTAKLTVLKELIEHHVEEEEDEFFKEAKKEIDKEEAEKLAQRFKEEKAKYQ